MTTPAPLAGHLGNLTPQEQSTLDEFKQVCREQSLYREADPPGKPSHDDATLLRFLRARKFHVQDAFQQFKDTVEWRQEVELDTVFENIEAEEFEETRRLYPQWTGRRDRRGSPVYLYKVQQLDAKTMNTYEQNWKKSANSATAGGASSTPPKMLRLFCLYEMLTHFVMPMCTALPDRPYPATPVTQSCNIVDISGVGLRQFWNLRSHMQDASTLATAHYPEVLDKIFIIGAPSFFPIVWSWIKAWFDPITVSKIFIVSAADTHATLAEHIDSANIPSQYGGSLKFAFGNPPRLDPAIVNMLDWTSPPKIGEEPTFPLGPAKWVDRNEKEMEALFIGKVGGKPRREVVAVMRRLEESTSSAPAAPTLNVPEQTLMNDETNKQALEEKARGSASMTTSTSGGVAISS
ncbi:MAG: hypothetical protein M1838_000975 [Thelocarpon superellum]|nr:MAG: hypothetical protein M1838_000975 [Thelocarpon superellum]